MTTEFARFLERIRGRVRRGASSRHSLAWWWLWDRQDEIPALLGRHRDHCWRILADALAEFSDGGVRIQPHDLRATWELVQEQAPTEREKLEKAAAKRRHAKAWKVEGKLPRNPVVAAEREKRLTIRRANLARWKRDREERASWPKIGPVFPPPPSPPSPEQQAQIDAFRVLLAERDRDRGLTRGVRPKTVRAGPGYCLLPACPGRTETTINPMTSVARPRRHQVWRHP
jgi:hypothetical protein